MSTSARLVDRNVVPSAAAVAQWIGARNAKRWVDLTTFINTVYPGAFRSEWLFGGSQHGWSLRFKASKSFCTLIPERSRLMVLLVFGAAERAKVEPILASLVTHVRDDYEQSTTYHDGKWVLINVDSIAVLQDVKRLLALKRKPKRVTSLAHLARSNSERSLTTCTTREVPPCRT